MMTRDDLLRSKEYWLTTIQNDLFNKVYEYMKENKLNKSQLAAKLGFTKGYITQVLNGDFDHRLSKFVEIALAVNKVPIIELKDLNQFITEDKNSIKSISVIQPTERMAVLMISKEKATSNPQQLTKTYEAGENFVLPAYQDQVEEEELLPY